MCRIIYDMRFTAKSNLTGPGPFYEFHLLLSTKKKELNWSLERETETSYVVASNQVYLLLF